MTLKKTTLTFAHRFYRALKITLFVALFIFSIVFYIYLHRPTTLPIQQVQVVGSYDYLDKTLLQDLITPYTKAGFFSVQLNALQLALLQLPWLEAVQVKRIWPDTLEIILTTRTPVAHFGEQSLLDENAIIFVPDTARVLPVLPQFDGPAENAAIMLKTYYEMNKVLSKIQMTIVSVELNQRNAWILRLDNGIVLYLGREQLVERVERFISTYQQIVRDKAAKVVSVDLRYENGLAVEWRK